MKIGKRIKNSHKKAPFIFPFKIKKNETKNNIIS
jgi:hypothetical protein